MVEVNLCSLEDMLKELVSSLENLSNDSEEVSECLVYEVFKEWIFFQNELKNTLKAVGRDFDSNVQNRIDTVLFDTVNDGRAQPYVGGLRTIVKTM
jgi:hypothetical protein